MTEKVIPNSIRRIPGILRKKADHADSQNKPEPDPIFVPRTIPGNDERMTEIKILRNGIRHLRWWTSRTADDLDSEINDVIDHARKQFHGEKRHAENYQRF